MQEFWNWVADIGFTIWDFFGDAENRDRTTAIATVAVTLIAVLGGVWALLSFLPKMLMARNQARKTDTVLPNGSSPLTEKLLEEAIEARIATRVEHAAEAHGDEKNRLLAEIGALKDKLRDPHSALDEARTTIKNLEDLLERSGNDIGGDKIAEARVALERGDYSIADALFAEIEERRKLEVAEAARAAFGRGEIAEAEIRWADAATHYARAAGLDGALGNFLKAREFAWRAGDYPTALRYGQDALKLARQGNDNLALGVALNNHALTLKATGRYDEAEPLFREDMEITTQTLGKTHPAYAIRLNNLARLLQATGRYEEAEPLFREALEITAQSLGKSHPAYAASLNNLAALLQTTERYDEAEPLYREALEIRAQTPGKTHPDYATSLNNLAALLQATGRHDEAEPLYREALEITAQSLGKTHPAYATSLNNLAGLLRATGRYEEAEPLYREDMEITAQTLGKTHPDYATSLNNLAGLLETTGRYDEAEPLYREDMEITAQSLGKTHPAYATSLNNLAILYYYMKRFEEALPLMEQALAIWKTALGAAHPDTVNARNSLAAMRAAAGG
ncbi:MAG: tetratricopeptide repeat protein [Alphaproteobacteria bacterium]|nr:tetratricopeptide repeat protein [Alphaproteobacteria bacterium]